jgi:RNA polymerase sigma factor (sigma-70 family)
VCREYRRGRVRDRHVLVGLEGPEFQAPQELEADERLDYLKEAMGRLSEKEREALHVYYLQDQDADQAQRLLGVSRSSFYRLLTKAKKKIEKFLESKTGGEKS